MSDQEVDKGRRRFLIGSTAVVGGAGIVAAGAAGVMYMSKSERTLALGAPIEVNISKLKPGEMMIEEWRSMPIWILGRTPEMLADMDKLVKDGRLKDPKSENTDLQPKYAQNQYRSIKKEVFVVIGICTHLGCSPREVRKTASHDLGADWKGGFLCACHGSTFDLAGRVFTAVPAQDNLKVPPHYYSKDKPGVIIVGQDEGAA